MSRDFYTSQEYRQKQSDKMKENWSKGVFDFHYKREEKVCMRKECGKNFQVPKSDRKIYCSRSCAAKVNNIKRGSWPEEVKLKIAQSLRGRKSPYKGTIKIPRVKRKCFNISCAKIFLVERYRSKKFCSNQCAMDVIGGKPTSPRAARGKAGARKDISKTIYFYSRWEANIARLFSFLNVKWIHQPKVFDLGSQKYTPDFYLPDLDVYIEVKNFMWKYSRIRDKKFRKVYPSTNLILLLKKDYLKLEKAYSHLIKGWEYKNTPFPS